MDTARGSRPNLAPEAFDDRKRGRVRTIAPEDTEPNIVGKRSAGERIGRVLRSAIQRFRRRKAAIDPSLAADVEAQRAPAVRRVNWRNSALDFSSVQALLDSLHAPPKSARLRSIERAQDAEALDAMTRVRSPTASTA